MSLAPGTKLGVYQIVATIGAGGMGEVYRASDTRLGRDVAIKVLPDAFARDPERLERFDREAKALAALNHPNVAQVYGFEGHALVMELLEGETLRERLSTGPLPIRKAVDYGAQIARGLAAAHERRIIHRDLKPDNVFVLRDGSIKILDFGLARHVSPASSSAGATVTQMSPATDPGTVMGTVGYMAPEQVRGGALDARTDLFALGCVLYEMITGQRAFRRETAAETMTAILNEDPPECSSTRTELSPALDRIVRHCLEKNPQERFQTARDVAFALNALSGSASAPAMAVPATRGRRRATWAWAGVTAVLLGIIAWLLPAARHVPPAVSSPLTYRVAVQLPEGFYDPNDDRPALRLAVSPDGRQVAISGAIPGQKGKMWIQSLTGEGIRALPGTDDAFAPFWSPDGRRLGLAANGDKTVQVLDLQTGATSTIGPSAAGSWGDRDTLILGRGGATIWRGTIDGAAYVPVLTAGPGEFFGMPSLLPGARRFLYSFRDRGRTDSNGIYAATTDGKTRTRIVAEPNDNINVAYANGALLSMRGASVVAQAFDPNTLTISGDAVTIASDVLARGGQGGAFSASRTGTLVYLPAVGQVNSRLTWFDRSGRVLQTVADDADYSNLELSPDDRRLLVSVTDPALKTRDIFVVDLASGVRQRLTFDPSEERSAVWTRDGRTVIYNAKGLDFYSRPSNFTGSETPVLVDGRSKDPQEVSPDGTSLLYRRSGDSTGNDLWILPLEGSRTPRLLVGTPFNDNHGSYSPDGQSIVYASDESGQSEIYVTSLASSGGKVQISTAGGSFPRWLRSSREILFLGLDGTMMSVPVAGSGASFHAAPPRPLFKIGVQPGAGSPFDVTADGTRFIVNAAIPSKATPTMGVVINWPALLTSRTKTP